MSFRNETPLNRSGPRKRLRHLPLAIGDAAVVALYAVVIATAFIGLSLMYCTIHVYLRLCRVFSNPVVTICGAAIAALAIVSTAVLLGAGFR